MSANRDSPESVAGSFLQVSFADRFWTVVSPGALLCDVAATDGPEERWLVIADLHLGKPAALREGGIAVPEGVTRGDLERLEVLVGQTRPDRLVVLGDFVHAALAPPSAEALKAEFLGWRRRSGLAEIPIDCVPGNHDRGSLAFLTELGIHVLADPHVDLAAGLGLVHDPDDVPESFADRVVWLCGHLHPCVRMREGRSSTFRLPCLWGQVARRCLVLPAFGGFTGTHPVYPDAGDCVVACRDGEIVDVSPFFASTGRAGGRATRRRRRH